jgi:hypothetical protein
MPAKPEPTTNRFAAWQRSLRHLHKISLAGLPFEPVSSGHLTVALEPLPPSVSVRLRLRARGRGRGSGVDALLMVVEDGHDSTVPPALIGTTLCAAAPLPISTHPQWPIDAAALPVGAGALRGVVIVVRQAEPRGSAGAAAASAHGAPPPPIVVWRRTVRFSELAHVVVDDARTLARALPHDAGALLLSFTDGVCLATAELAPLAEAGLLERMAWEADASTLPPRKPCTDAEAFAQEVERLAARRAEMEGANATLRTAVDAQLDARAADLHRRSELATHAAALEALRESHAAARAELESEQTRVAALRDELAVARSRFDAHAHAEGELVDDAQRALDAASEGRAKLEGLRARVRERRAELLSELVAAVPLGGSTARAVKGAQAHAPSAADAQSTNGGADEEEVSATLGAAAQLVAHGARLLGVTLRYPMRLLASRSTIDEPPPAGGAAASSSATAGRTPPPPSSAGTARQPSFPLYTRSSEPHRLQHGLQLFCRNVQQLLLAMGEAAATPPRQILPALHTLVQRIHAGGPPPVAQLWAAAGATAHVPLAPAASSSVPPTPPPPTPPPPTPPPPTPPPPTPPTPATPATPATPSTGIHRHSN